MAGKNLETVKTETTLEVFKDNVSLQGWANSLVKGTKYTEPDPDYLARRLLYKTLTATTAEKILSDDAGDGLQKIIPNAPEAGTGPITITDLYVAASDLNEGAPTYILLTYVKMSTGESVTTTTGAQMVQAQLLALVNLGIWPIKCQIRRTDRLGKSDKYLFKLFQAD